MSNTWWQPPAITESATIIEAPVGTFFDLEVANGEFTDLFAASAVFNVLQGASANFDELFVDSGTFQDLEAVTGVFSMLEVTSGSFEELQAANAVFTNVESESGTFTNLEAKTGTFTNLVAKSGVTIGEGGDVATITRYLSAMSELDFSLAANSCEDLEVAVDGAGITGDTVVVGAPASLNVDLSVTGFVKAIGLVNVRLCNPTAMAIDPAPGSYRVDVWQHQEN